MRIYAAQFALAAALGCTARADSINVVQGGPIQVSGFTDGKTAVTLTKEIIVQAPAEVSRLVLDQVNLQKEGGGTSLSPTAITVPGVKLGAGEYVPITVTITLPPEAGVYAGSFRLRAPSDNPAAGTPVQISATLVGKPKLSVAQVGITSYHCWWDWSCRIGALLAHTKRSLTVQNGDGAGDATLRKSSLFLRRVDGIDAITEQRIGLDAPPSVAVSSPATLTFNVPNELDSGRYEGFLRLEPNNAEAVNTPVSLDVRDAPLIALVLIVAGVLFGRMLVKSNETPAAASSAEESAPHPSMAVRTMATLAATEQPPSHAKWPWLRPLSFLVLLAALALIGLYTLYVKNTTFGSDRVYDYFGVAAWGLSADITQRTLQKLDFKK